MLADPALADPAPPPDEVLSAEVWPAEVLPDEVAPPEAGALDVGETDVEGLALTDLDAAGVGLGLAVADGVAVAGQGVLVAAAAFLLSVALVLAFADADVVAVLVAVALPVAVAVVVAVAVAVLVAVAVPLPPGPAVSLAVRLLGLLPPLGGLITGLAEGTLGLTGLAGLPAADGEADRHPGPVRLLWAAEVRPWLAPPPEPSLVPDPARLWAPPLFEEEIPTAEPSWTKASRSGGSARATPMANTAQAAARAGRSSPYRQSRGWRAPGLPLPSASWPPRTAFQRRTRSARKPLRAEALECLLA